MERAAITGYETILRQAVAVIEHARQEIAKHINGYVSTAYWEIGQLLHERKIESGHGDGVVKKLSLDLKERYPKLGASPRNLWDMKRFYERFHLNLIFLFLHPWSSKSLAMSDCFHSANTLPLAKRMM